MDQAVSASTQRGDYNDPVNEPLIIEVAVPINLVWDLQ
jgi:hypothetical protein